MSRPMYLRFNLALGGVLFFVLGNLSCAPSLPPHGREQLPLSSTTGEGAETLDGGAFHPPTPSLSPGGAGVTAPTQKSVLIQDTQPLVECESLSAEAEGIVAPDEVRFRPGLPNLDKFYAALNTLVDGTRLRPVRIMWLGDSHTAADFMTDRVRERLNKLVRPGGPGFLRLGLEGYRHGGVRLSAYGTIRKAPILPAQRTRVLDGVFGYGGIRTRPMAGAGVIVRVEDDSVQPLSWTFSYRLPAKSRLEVQLGEQIVELKERVGTSKDSQKSSIRSIKLSGTAQDKFAVRYLAGDPEIFGVSCEYDEPGVVLDTVGINGARTATVLAWEPKQFIDEVRARSPDLLVLAFGSNEVFDRTNVTHYVDATKEVIARVREARADLPCWVIGPPDAAKKSGGSLSRVETVTAAHRQAAVESGCAFTSASALMGGEGSFTRWAKARPRKARSDRVHLTIAGYTSLGDLLAETLLPLQPTALSATKENH